MKFVFTLLLISFSTVSFSQMTFSDILKIYKMDMDQFEEYAISRGYEFHEFDSNENEDAIILTNGVRYVKGLQKGRKYLTLYDKYFGRGKNVDFQTANSSEVLRIKTEIKKFKYKLSKSYFMDETKVDKYSNGTFILEIFTNPPNDEVDFVRYEISFEKYYKD